MKKKIFIIVFIQGSLFLSFAQTNIPPGNVNGTWGINGSPYNVQGDITIPNDSTLTIEPGVLVEFQGFYALNVQGRLLAVGTETKMISFIVDDTTGFYNPNTTIGGWNGIQFIDTPSDNDTSKIIYCTLQFGKAVGSSPPENSGGAIFISNFNKIIISNCLISNSSAGGSDSPSGGALSLHFANIILEKNVIGGNHARDGGGIKIWESDPIFINNRIISNTALEGGGGIWIGGLSNCKFTNDFISGNYAGSNGGGIMCWQATNSTLNSVEVIGNFANWGGGIGVIDCEMQLNNCIINDNTAIALGGGIGSDFSTLNINNTSFERDTAGFQSGGIHAWYSDVQINHSNFIDNQADLGGAIHAEFSMLEIDSSNFLDNRANNGGGLQMRNCNLSIDSCLFYQNDVTNEGGAIEFTADTFDYTSPYNLEILNSKFNDNSAAFRGGGIRIEQFNSENSIVNTLIDKCYFKNNHADRNGGLRIAGNISDLVISNSIFESNTSNLWIGAVTISENCDGKVYNCNFVSNSANSGSSGAVGIGFSSKVDFFNCTFANNFASTGAGLHVRRGSYVTITNSILWGNYPDQISLSAVIDSFACTLYVNHCDIQYGIDSVHINDTVSVVHWGAGNIDEYPLFIDTLNNNFRLQDMSPCIAEGIDSIEIAGFWHYAPLTDIEGNPRPNPAGTVPDIGAYESQFPSRVESQNSELLTEFSLSQNYPNPFNPTTKIKFTIPSNVILSEAKNLVTLKVYDVLGNEISTLINEDLSAGEYEVELNAEKLTSGIYFYQLKSENFVETKKMILLK